MRPDEYRDLPDDEMSPEFWSLLREAIASLSAETVGRILDHAKSRGDDE